MSLLDFLPWRRRPPVQRFLPADLRTNLMALQETVDTLAADIKQLATVAVQTNTLAVQTAAAATAQGKLLEAHSAVLADLAKAQGVDTTAADAALKEASSTLATLTQTATTTAAAVAAAAPAVAATVAVDQAQQTATQTGQEPAAADPAPAA
ncbi:hypothetical protein [Methylobacterium sp. JK268]